MFELIRNLRRRIVGRMLLFVVLPTLLIFASIVYATNVAVFENLKQAEERFIQLQARFVATQVDDLTAGAVISAQRMAEAQVAGMFGDREASIEYARSVLENFDGVTGAYFGYEPNADGNDVASLGKLPPESMDLDGRFIPYWFVSSTKGRSIELEPLVDMESSLYYSGAKQDFEKTKKAAYKVTEPYIYQGKMITEQVFPIVIDGEFKGVAGVDFALADIDAQLHRVARAEGFDIFLLSSQGNVIAATTDAADSTTEIGSESLTTQNLNGLVGNVKRASIQLNSTATELSATSRQQEATANSFGATANQIAAATKQISATNLELLRTMEDVNQVAVGTAELATAGRSSLQGMEDNMRDLDKATGSIGDKLAAINEKASNITGIVTTITKVADQTNLLSVNAAIEAEKAGEYGVGFLVVAREIRRLADRTSAATLDIEQMVQQMQSAVSAGVMEMDRFTDHVRRNVKDVATISQQMSDIIEQVNGNTAKFESVNESMQSQAQGADQISNAMLQLTTNATQTSEAIREYARAADDLKRAIDSMKSSIASFLLTS